MNRLLMIAVATLAFAGTAAAAEMPKGLQGSWCKTATTPATTTYQWTAESCPPELDEINVGPTGFRTFPEINCRLRKRAGDRMTFSCEGGPAMELIWTRKRDVLTITH
jgi:hypothetical protein